jgi:multidrug efflux pump subunit AcrA (membrane-fusion protein)
MAFTFNHALGSPCAQALRCIVAACALGAMLPTAAIAQGQSNGVYKDHRSQQDDYVRYLGARCSGLHDLLNPGPYNQGNYQRQTEAQALRMRDARREYNEYCQEEVSIAREKASKVNQAQRQDRLDTARQEKEQSAAQQRDEERKRQQCTESRRIIATKKQRTDLNPGEIQELARFEENFRSRCASPSSSAATAR